MRISDWSSDVCSSDLPARLEPNDLVQLVPDAVPAPFFHIFAEPIMIDVNLFGVSHSSFPSLFRRPASDSMPPMAIKSATCSISPRAIGAGQRDPQICRVADRLEKAPSSSMQGCKEIRRASCRERVCQYV